MIAYIVRRTLYALPILVGVNLIVFGLFFFVNSPDDMARAHLGQKRVTPEQIDGWKRERSLDLPYFYNAGWQRLGAVARHPARDQRRVSARPAAAATRWSSRRLRCPGIRSAACVSTAPSR